MESTQSTVFVLFLCLVVPISRQGDPAQITFRCETASNGRLFTTITLPAEMNSVKLLSGEYSEGLCSYPVDSSSQVDITFRSGIGHNLCGLTRDDSGRNIFGVSLTTSSCPYNDAPCVLDTDYKIEFSCDYENPQQEVMLANNLQVAGSAPVGKTLYDGEDVRLFVMKHVGTDTYFLKDLTRPTSTSLGEYRYLFVFLNPVNPEAQDFKVLECSFHLPDSDVFIPFIENECTGYAHTHLFEGGLNFVDVSSPNHIYRDFISPPFAAFIWPNSSDLMIGCTVEFCATQAECVQKTCPSRASVGRKRRSISKTNVRKLYTLLRVAPHNGTSAPAQKSMHLNPLSVCNNEAYIIGLATLGFALAWTLLLTIGRLLLFKRSQPHNAKTADVNNSAC